ncbi:MAG: adenylyl-sulfate kinase [Cenarchaeum symbiont of Oopsacas minuta]|nr:adenylyl-sulfate kinase [Cenarchaeum symbiont of Oopsacas minuta]
MAFVLWMTGLPCSGKTTLVKRLQKDIPNLAMLDGDQLREWLSPKDFSKEARNEHNKRVAHLAKLLQNHGISSVVSLISPYAENRKNAKEIIGDGSFSEVYVKCSLEQCEKRDVKGMYAKARAGVIKGFTGIDDPYEAPEAPDLALNTEVEDLEESTNSILDYLKSKNQI